MKVEHFLQATSLEEAYTLLQSKKDNYVIAGGAWMKLSLKKADTLIALDHLPLGGVIDHPTFLEIGSMATLRYLELNPLVKDLGCGVLQKAIQSIMGVTIRNIATIGGSVVSKFGFSDLIPVLLLFDTTLVFYKHGEISLNAYLESHVVSRDILVSLRVKKTPGSYFFKKVKTTALDFAILNIAIAKTKNGFQIVVGSRPGGALFAEKTMAFVNSEKNMTVDVIENAARMASEEISVSSNVRSSEEYRKQLIYVYVKRGLKEVTKDEN